MKKIFISYSSQEYDIANKYRAAFTERGISCWMAPESIPTGSNYAVEIPKAIQDCQVFVLILSDKSQESIWVRKEIDLAVNLHKLIFPIKTGNYQLVSPFNFYLTDVQMMMSTEDPTKIAAKLDSILDPDAAAEELTSAVPLSTQQQTAPDDKKKNGTNKVKIAVIAAAAVLVVAGAVGIGALISSGGKGDDDIVENDTVAVQHENNEKTQDDDIKAVGNDGSYTLIIDEAVYNGTYTGDMNAAGLPEGNGTFIGEKQDGIKVEYIGSFKNGTYNGQGTQTMTSKDGDVYVYECGFVDGKRSGNGKQTNTYANGETKVYEGPFANGKSQYNKRSLREKGDFTLFYLKCRLVKRSVFLYICS